MRRTVNNTLENDFLPIPVHSLVPNHCMAVDLYIRESRTGPFQLYRAHDTPFQENDRERLANNGVRNLFISKSSHRLYQDHLRENLTAVLSDESQDITSRFACLSEVMRDTMSAAMSKDDVDQCVNESSRLAEQTVSLLQRDDYVVTELLGVLHHDYCTFTHSTNVAVMCGMLGQALGITDPLRLQQITAGGLLHDLGKQEVPDQILAKPARLSDAEFDIVKNHARWGYEKLCRRTDVTYPQLMMAYQHHERVAGGGYPVGCPKEDIHDWARICTVVDVYEALTANRPYRTPMTAKELREVMTNGSGKIFDPEMLKCWQAIITKK